MSLIVLNPATEERIAELEQAGVEQTDEGSRAPLLGLDARVEDRCVNDTHTPYGLSGSIWTRDGARALRVARALETGVLSVNSNSSVRVQTPFEGFKQFGFGRELGMQAFDGYSEAESVFISTEEA